MRPSPDVALGALARTLEMFTGRAIQLEPDRARGTGSSDETEVDVRRQRDVRMAADVALPTLEAMLGAGRTVEVRVLWWLYVHRGVEARRRESAAGDDVNEWLGLIAAPSRAQLVSWCRSRGKVSTAGARKLGERVSASAHDSWGSAVVTRTSEQRRPWLAELSAWVQRRVSDVHSLRWTIVS